MNDETPINEDSAPVGRKRRLPRGVPEPAERVGFALQERVIWPLQDRFGDLGGSRPSRDVLLGGGAAAFLAGVAIVFALTSGGGSSAPTTTAAKGTSPREPLAAVTAPADPQPQTQPRQEPPGETLHGAAPVFSPPSSAGKGGEKTGESKAAAADAASAGGSTDSGAADGSSEANASEAGSEATDSASSAASSGDSPSPAAARISSDPGKPATATSNSDPTAGAATARPAVPSGPPAGPAALKVAREFAEGFVVYETGGEASAFEDAFAASATPKLKQALLQRPPKQPAGVKVPRAKVLNVVAGPSRDGVYKVSVSLLRVGVTSELRLDMEATKKGKRVEWRVTNVLG